MASFWLAVVATMVAAGLLAVIAAASLRRTALVVAVVATITAFPSFLNALPPCFFGALHPLAGFGAVLFAHVVPMLPPCGRRPFALGRAAGASFGLAAVVAGFGFMVTGLAAVVTLRSLV